MKAPGLLAWLAYIITWLLFKSCRFVVSGVDHLNRTQKNKIVVLWHDQIAIAPQLLHQISPQKRYTAVISNSRDGELLARIVSYYRFGSVIRVPHNRKHEALHQMIRLLKESKGTPVITPDGPRGPRHEVKGGVVIAAQETDAVIIPLTWRSTRYWEFKTWDRMRLPKPFSTIVVDIGEPIDMREQSPEEARVMLQNKLRILSTTPSEA